jgi:hypothetical protein
MILLLQIGSGLFQDNGDREVDADERGTRLTAVGRLRG